MAMEYHHYDTVSIFLEAPKFWNFLTVLAMTQRVILISWVPPSLEFVKANLNGIVHGAKDSVGCIIQELDGSLLATEDFFFL